MTFYKINGNISRYPPQWRLKKFVDAKTFEELMSNPDNNKDYDMDKSFFENFQLLMNDQSFPYVRVFGPGAENCAYSDTTYNAKNAYLSITVCFDVENVLYSYHVSWSCKNVLNSVFVSTNSEIIYQSSDITSSQKVFFSSSVNDCYDIWFSHNMMWCQECIACNDLVNKSYHIENIPYSKEEYTEKKEKALHQYLHKEKTTNFDKTGASLFQCHDLENGIFCSYMQSWRNVCFVSRDNSGEKKRLFDTMSSGGAIEDAYGCMGVSPGDNFYLCVNAGFCSHIYYSIFLSNCSYCLGCIGLKNKSFCILNKQYTKEERFELVNKIFAQMEKDWSLWDFFPPSMNPFYFNDTAAYLIDGSFTKAEATKDGYLRRDEAIATDIPDGVEVVNIDELNAFQGFTPNGDWNIDPEILKKVIKDKKGNCYRIIKMEYDFLMKYGLPLPEIHWLERIRLGFACD